jgi:hypothetical protein
MKRQLLAAAVLAAPLYLRQREVEKRQRLWRRGIELQLEDVLTRWRKADHEWSEKLVEEVNRATRGEYQ